MDMIRRDYSGEDFHVFFKTGSSQKISGSKAYLAFQDVIAVFGYPTKMNLKVEYSMGGFAVFIGHALIILKLSPEGEGNHPPKLRPYKLKQAAYLIG